MQIKKIILFSSTGILIGLISLLVLIIILVSAAFSSCHSFRTDIMAADTDKIAETRLQEIIVALEDKDEKAIRKMFSESALKESDDFDGGIAYIMNCFQGEVISKEITAPATFSNKQLKETYEIDAYCTVETTEGNYIISFLDRFRDDNDHDNIGLHNLIIIKEGQEEKPDWSETFVGIYHPTDEK